MGSICITLSRFLISLFHICSGAGAILCVSYTIGKWGTEANCLPPMPPKASNSVKLFSLNNDTGLCEGIYTMLGVTAFMNIIMCIVYNCFWTKKGVLILNMFMSLAIGSFVIFSAAMLVMYHMTWCQSMQQKMKIDDCSRAAVAYDQDLGISQLSLYYNRLQIETVGLLLMIPVSIINVLLYGIAIGLPPALPVARPSDPAPPTPTIPKDTTPLLTNLEQSNDFDETMPIQSSGSTHDYSTFKGEA